MRAPQQAEAETLSAMQPPEQLAQAPRQPIAMPTPPPGAPTPRAPPKPARPANGEFTPDPGP